MAGCARGLWPPQDAPILLGFPLHRRRVCVLHFSKKFDNHCHALAIYFVWYNFVKIHKAHKLTPAMAAGITDKLWSVEDIVALVEASEPKPGKRGPYKQRVARRASSP
jgi:hypothetical protein